MSRTAVVISDLHVLGQGGLLRPGFVTSEGNKIGLNPFQKWLWRCYESCLEELDSLRKKDKPILIANGDLIDGNHHRTIEILHPDPNEHAKAAIYTLEPLVNRCSKIYITEGTEVHTGDFEAYIGKELDAEKHKNGRHVFPELWIEVHGCLGLVHHHMPTTARKHLEASQLSIQLANARSYSSAVNHQMPKWVAMGHRHASAWYTDGNIGSLVTPGWQGLTRYGRRVVPHGKTTPGLAFMDWRHVPKGFLPRVDLIIRNPRQPKIIKAI
jgi:hypothetical protein